MKDFIIEKLNTLKVKNNDKLIEYVDFCCNNNIGKHHKNVTEKHHILPKSLFKEFEDLSIHKWNATFITYENHYIAHSLLFEAFYDDELIFAWWNMNSQNINKLTKTPEDIIGPERYKELRENHYNIVSKMPHLVNKSPITIEKRLHTMSLPDENGETILQKNGRKISDSLSDKVYSFNLKTQLFEHIDKKIFDTQWYSVGRTAKYITIYEYNDILYTNRETLCLYNNIDISVTKTDYGRFKPYRRIVLTIDEII